VHVLFCKFALNPAGGGHLKAPLPPFAAFFIEELFWGYNPGHVHPITLCVLFRPGAGTVPGPSPVMSCVRRSLPRSDGLESGAGP
jgi:hypothetical protein